MKFLRWIYSTFSTTKNVELDSKHECNEHYTGTGYIKTKNQKWKYAAYSTIPNNRGLRINV